MALTKEQRDALGSDQFAVPGKRALPIHDRTHVKMAWDMVDKTKGLSDAERKAARAHILRKAKELGVDTSGWHTLKGMRIDAMAIMMPETPGHPNKVPFSGILTRVDEPSDNPVGGTDNKHVYIPKEVAEEALHTLLGMAVDFTDHLDGHDPQQKIGLITEAWIEGSAVHISGFFWGGDFPMQVKAIQGAKGSLGFSYEAEARVRSLDDDPLVVESLAFTGAAVLQKDKAAYTTTSLSAKSARDSEKEREQMELKDLQDAITKLAASVETIGKEVAEVKKTQVTAASVNHLVKPHADAMRQCAANMEAAGIGTDASAGHAALLRKMADHMEAESHLGRMPSAYSYYAMAAGSAPQADPRVDALTKQLETMSASLADLSTLVKDVKAASFKAAAEPTRKTIAPEVQALLAKAGVTAPEEGKKLDTAMLDKAFTAAGMNIAQRLTAKVQLAAQGLIEPN